MWIILSFHCAKCHSGLDPESHYNNAEILAFARMTKEPGAQVSLGGTMNA